MVQRKVPSKLGVQADHVKSEKRLGNLKPSSCQHQDGKNRGPDMKKKMKRQRSVKLSDIGSLKSSPLRKTVSQPGKPSPVSFPTTVATPQKQPMIKTTGGSPNYMKATSSSEARKERSHVSSLITPSSSDSKNLRRRNSGNSKLSSASRDKPTRSLTRSSSLKLVRTLTKTPSFKPARSAAKKCSRVALCADVNVQKATCSSTLKDSKFPAYLMLNPGGTEAEGTSVLKVCPYTYCSLNGHHHAHLPPLKSFLKAKRRSMKAQKSTKLEVPFLCRDKPSSDGTEEISCELSNLSGEKSREHEANTIVSIIPIVKEVDMDFFIEIYAKSADTGTEATGNHAEDDEGKIDFAGEYKETNNESFFHGGEQVAAAERDNRKQGAEEVTNGSLYLKIDYTSMEEDENISEVSDMEWEEGQLSTSEILTAPDCSNKPEKEYGINVEYLSDTKQLDLHDDMISNCTEEILGNFDEVLQELFEEENASFDAQSRHSDPEIEEMLQELFEEETILTYGDLTYDQLSSIEDAFFEEPTTVEEIKSEGAKRELTGAANTSTPKMEPIAISAIADAKTEDNGVSETDHDITKMIYQLGDADNDCSIVLGSEDLNDHQEDRSLQAKEAIELLQVLVGSSQESDEGSEVETDEDQKLKETEADENVAGSACNLQEFPCNEAGEPTEEIEEVANVKTSAVTQFSDSSESSFEVDQDDVKVNDSLNHITAEACQCDNTAEDRSSGQEPVTETELSKHCDNLLDGKHESINVAEDQNLLDGDQDGANKFKILTSTDLVEHSNLGMSEISPAKNDAEVEKMEVEVCSKPDTEESTLAAKDVSSVRPGSRYLCKGSNTNRELASICNRKWTIKSKKPIMESEEERNFNPREPNFLPLVPDPEAEKVDLKHQIMDDRKNSEEWMIDYALQQTVTKLAPARKRKVALLVEAFEAVLPVPRYQNHIRNTSAAFSHTRPIQACS